MILFFTIFGLLVGSFLNALIYRLPRDINIALPRSSCTQCKKLIYWYENIPILSYIFLKGKCSGCQSKISLLYPFVEFIVACFAFSIAPKNLEPDSLLNFFFYFSIFCAFLVHFIIDLKHQILPDSITIYMACVFLLLSIFNKPLTFWLVGGLIGLGFPLMVTWIFYKIKGQVGLGGGDIKLYGALGLYLGPVGIMQNIFLSCFLGAIVGIFMIAFKVMKKENPIPFGPFIIVVGAFQIFSPELFAYLISYIP
ncbi:MAG: prepilin peptidase [Bacteriovoracaceae bacterium]|nr:prepilin peptidase [Bacteriovoracaceae bacterium]